MKHWILALVGVAALITVPSHAAADDATCHIQFEVVTTEAHGTLPAGSVLAGEMRFHEGRKMRMGTETISYLSRGPVTVTAKDGSRIQAALRAIHMVRTPHFADYASFDAKDVSGDLGGITSYEAPLLLTLYAPRGSLSSFDLPKNTAAWDALSKRRAFQVHTPNTMQTLSGTISAFQITCK